MAWQVFGTKTSPNAMSTLDTQSGNLAQWSIVDTTATGTDAITLAPTLSGYTAPAYANYVSYRFVAANTTAGSVTLRVSALALINVYYQDGTTQVGSGGIVSGYSYMVTYNSTLNGAAGGWYLTPIGSSATTLPDPVTVAKGGTGQVTAPAARGSSGLNIDQATSTSFNADSSIAATTRIVVSSTTAMTGAHTLTLPAANAVNAGQALSVIDLNGVVGANALTVQRAGADTINGGTTTTITTQYAGVTLVSDGTSKWSALGTGNLVAGSGITVSGSTVSINTNNSVGVGAYALMFNGSGGTVNNGSTTAGSGLLPAFGIASASQLWDADGSAPAGTWRNISGRNSLTLQYGLWIRTA